MRLDTIGTHKKKVHASKSLLNVSSGVIYQIINSGLGLFLPYLFITNLGSESNGLLNSIGQLFTCLSLLEAGVGTATLQALYSPVSKKDKAGINRILSATNHYYRRTGVIYAGSVVLLSLIYPSLVDSQLSDATIRLSILLQGAGTVIGYFIQAKYNFFLQAEGKNYIHNFLLLGESILRNVGKIVAIHLGYGLVAVQTVHFLVLGFEALFMVVYIHRRYKWMDLRVKPDYAAISQKNSVLLQSIAWMVFNHTDILVLTIFSRSLSMISVYSVYLLVFEAVQNVMNTVRNSFQYKIGQLYCKSAESMQQFYRRYSLKISAITGALFMITYLLSTPFVRIYTANANDANYILAFIPEMFLIYKVLYNYRGMVRQAVEATGHFRETQNIATVEACINISVSILLVIKMGIYGVLLGTVAALIYSTVRYTYYVGRKIMKGQVGFLFGQLVLEVVPLFGAIIYNHLSPIQADSIIRLVIVAIPLSVLTTIVYFVVWKVEDKILQRRK